MAARGCLRWMIWPGTPTTTESGGTGLTTTALAPIRLSWPIVIGPEHLGPGPDRHPVAHRRVPLAALQAGAAERDTVVDGHVGADLGGLADDHPVA